MTEETVVVPIKFGTLNLQRGSEVGVIPARLRHPRGKTLRIQADLKLSVASVLSWQPV